MCTFSHRTNVRSTINNNYKTNRAQALSIVACLHLGDALWEFFRQNFKKAIWVFLLEIGSNYWEKKALTNNVLLVYKEK